MALSLWNYDPFLTTTDPFAFDPWREMRRMQREMDRLFERAGKELVPSSSSVNEGMTLWRPIMDIKETDKDMVLKAELPGVKKEDINIELENGVLTISGEKKEEKKEENERYRRSERCYGKFVRSLTVPQNLTQDQIKAKFDNGVLEVTFPKLYQEKKQLQTIPIS
jgi:HSP20 family protein